MSTGDEATRWRRAIRWAALLAAAWCAVLAVAALWWAGPELATAVARVDATLWLTLAACFTVNYAARFARWHHMLVAEGHRVPLGRSLAIFMAGLALVPTPGKAGVAVRSLLLLREGVPVNVSLAAHFSERLLDLLGLLALAALLVPGSDATRALAALAALAAGLVLVRVSPRLITWLRSRARAGSRIALTLDWLHAFAGHAAHLAAGRHALPWLALGIASNVATAALLWYAATRLATAVSFAEASGVLAVSHLTGSLSLLPGGLGGFELAMLAQLAALGVSAAAALVATVLVRLSTVWIGVLLGLPPLLVALKRT